MKFSEAWDESRTFRIIILGGVTIILVCMFILMANQQDQQAANVASPAVAPPVTAAVVPHSKKRQQENKRFEQCRAKLKKAQKLDLLYDLKIDPLPRVIVGPTFYSIPLDAKQGFADTVNCFLMTGKNDEYINFDLMDYQTGHVVAEYYAGQLKVK
jgi:hypothetical protein